jgi:hypothetical protein
MKRIAIIIAAVFLAGCSHQAPAPSKAPESGGNFMPLYLDMISGKAPQKGTCEAHSLKDLMLPMPCDENGR